MNSSPSHWSFFKTLSTRLHHAYGLAYQHCHEDPENTLVKLRACALVFVDKITHYYQLEEQSSLYDKINHADFIAVIPYHVHNKLNFLRVTGNKGAHPENNFRSRKAAIDTAIIALRTCHKLALWLYENLYQSDSDTLPAFVPPDPILGEQLYRQAIRQRDADAQYSIGILFKQDWLHKQQAADYQDAHYWLEKASQQDHVAAHYQLGQHLLEKSDQQQQAIDHIQYAADQHDANALYTLGYFMLSGQIDDQRVYPQDHSTAIDYFEQAAQQEHLGALNELVKIYYEGLGVTTDLDKAFNYAQNAALAGYPSAQFKLAHLYQAGMGATQDSKEAFHWYKRAAEGGDADAQVVLFKYYSAGEQTSKDLTRALEWLYLADAQHHPGAAYYLGMAYQRGIGVTQDTLRSINLFKRCIDSDNDNQYPAAKIEFMQGATQLRRAAMQAAQQKSLQNHPHRDKLRRNDPCPCGSGKKYKKCCLHVQH